MSQSSNPLPPLWAYSNIARAATLEGHQPFLVVWTVARQWLDPDGSGIVSRRELIYLLTGPGPFSKPYARQLLRDPRGLIWWHSGKHILHLRSTAHVAAKFGLSDIGHRQALPAPRLAAGRASRRAAILAAALPTSPISQAAIQKETHVSPRTVRRYIAAGYVRAHRNDGILTAAFNPQQARSVAREHAHRGTYTKAGEVKKRLPNTHIQPLAPVATGSRTREINRQLRGTQSTSSDLSREKGIAQPARVYFPTGSAYCRFRGSKTGTGQGLNHPAALDIAYIAGPTRDRWTAVGMEIRP